MTYYYDSEARVMLAVDPETEDIRILDPIDFEEDEPAIKSVKVKPAAGNKKTPGSGCPECGSKSRHRKECSKAGGAKSQMVGNKAWKDLGEVSVGKDKVIARMEFGRVKIAQTHDIPTEVIAKDMRLSEAEVSKAIEAETYDDYRTS